MSYEMDSGSIRGRRMGAQPWRNLPKWAQILTCGCMIAFGLVMAVFAIFFLGIFGMLSGVLH